MSVKDFGSPILARLESYKHHSPKYASSVSARKNGQHSSSEKNSCSKSTMDRTASSLFPSSVISNEDRYCESAEEVPSSSTRILGFDDSDSDDTSVSGTSGRRQLKQIIVSSSDDEDSSSRYQSNKKQKASSKRIRISSSESSQDNPGSPSWMGKKNSKLLVGADSRSNSSSKIRKKARVVITSDSEESGTEKKQNAEASSSPEDITQGASIKEQLVLLRKQRKTEDDEADSSDDSDLQKAIQESLSQEKSLKSDDSFVIDLTEDFESPNKGRNGLIKSCMAVPSKLSRAELKQKCLEFFNRAAPGEMNSAPKCSAKMVEIVLMLRPFKSYEHLISDFEGTRGLSVSVVSAYMELLEAQSNLERLLSECSRRSLELHKAVQQLMAYSETDKQREQPSLLNERLRLKPYQKVGLNWLILMHKQKLNAILADEMGLGKTIQVIAFLAHLKETSSRRSVHLIVVPSSTIDNWHLEFHRWWPSVRVLNYYGGQDDRLQIRTDLMRKKFGDVDIILTTYNMVTSKGDDRSFFKRFHINYVIYDEAHMLKNFTTKRYQSLLKIRSQRKLLLTGTPLQNNLVELMSLMYFVLPELFRDFQDDMGQILNLFQQKNSGVTIDYGEEKISQAKQIMMPFVLRRLKEDVLNQLPNKMEKVLRCPLVEQQRKIYDEIISSCRKNKEQLGGGRGMKILMELRKAANHPLLLRHLYTGEKLEKMSALIVRGCKYRGRDPVLVKEDMEVMTDFELNRLCKENRTIRDYCIPDDFVCDSGKFKVLDEILPEFKAKEEKVLLFSQFTMVLDILENYLKVRGHEYVRLDGQTPVVERQGLINEFNGDTNKFVFLLSTRAGGLGINLTSASVIILHDIDYNPYNDRQAEDRCHRVGQTKEVTVVKLIGENTVEENMFCCAKKKLELEVQVTRNAWQSTVPSDNGEEDNQTVESLLKAALHL